MRMFSILVAAAALAATTAIASAQITNVPIGNVNVSDDWECIATLGNTTYTATGSFETDASDKLMDAGYAPPFACAHRGDDDGSDDTGSAPVR